MDCVAPFDEVTIPGNIITSPNYPGNYGNNMDCQLTVRFAADEIVAITFDEIDVDVDELSCESDYLTLYDGDTTSSRIIDKELCGKYSRGKTFKSTGNVMTLQFKSDDFSTRSGFKIYANNEYNYCGSNPCQNGGACENVEDSYKCVCGIEYEGDNCEIELTVRLVNGTSPNEGRVELLHEGKWGTVCDDDWDIEDANVVCKMLGYPSALRVSRLMEFGEGTGKIILDDVNCTGLEKNITECSHEGFYSNN